ncbi:MAG: phosphoribosylformylglycinamidine synthase subunit PurQ [Patescibacteria group bacterium]|jgi:phosphoribosylformylglycinamidine synthase
MRKRVAILFAPGTNCHNETREAFKLAGADARLIFVDDILAERENITDCDCFFVPGGFSYGDHINTGAIVAILLREYFPRLLEAGILVGGECNGFQILMRAGFFGNDATLTENDSRVFCSRPVLHRVIPNANCLWTRGLEGHVLKFPAAHHGGKLVGKTDRLSVVMTYHSLSPNGGNIAAICSSDGRIFGIMDHMTRPYDNPHGLVIFQNALNAT